MISFLMAINLILGLCLVGLTGTYFYMQLDQYVSNQALFQIERG